MKYPVFSYRDEKTCFGNLIMDTSEAAAVRGFSYAVNNPSGIMHFAPEDFSLWHVGDFDTDTGIFSPKSVPKLVIRAASILERSVDDGKT